MEPTVAYALTSSLHISTPPKGRSVATSVNTTIGGADITFETGRLAHLSDGAVYAVYGKFCSYSDNLFTPSTSADYTALLKLTLHSCCDNQLTRQG